MRDFGYTARGRAVNEAQAEVHAAFRAVVDRWDEGDPRTQRWRNAIEAFHVAAARVYPDPLRRVDQGIASASEVDTADMLDFLEADPVFYRSGYMKQKLLKELKRRKLDRHEVERMQAIILNVVCQPDHRREFSHYCRVAAAIADEGFRGRIEDLARGRENRIAQRAKWVLAAIDGDWPTLKAAMRASIMRQFLSKYPQEAG